MPREPDAPLRAKIVRFFNIVEALQGQVDGQFAEPDDATNPAAQRHRPLVIGFPVRGNQRRAAQVPAVVQVVVDEGLPGKQADFVRAAVIREGLRNGDQIVTTPLREAGPGSKVLIR